MISNVVRSQRTRRIAVARFVAVAVAAALLAACAAGRQVSTPHKYVDGVRKRPDLPGEWADFQIQRRVPAGAEGIPMDAFARAKAQMQRMPVHSARDGRLRPAGSSEKAGAPRWEFLGPTNIAGRTRTLVFDPRDADRMITGGVSGGLWQTRDGGASWTVLSADIGNLNIGALAFDPAAPDTIYVGTGELYRNTDRPYSAMWGQGILRSRDGGATFQPLLATATADFRYVSDIVVSPFDPRRLYAATNSGIWRSRDAGASFEQILRPAENEGTLRYEGCNELLLLPDRGADYLLASCASRSTDDRYYLPGTVVPPACEGPCPAAVFLNEDASGSGQFVQVLSETGMGRTSMDFARSSPNVVYAVSASVQPGFDRTGDSLGDYENGLHAVWRSDDGGRTWRPTLRNDAADALSTYLLSYADGFHAPQCGFGGLFVYGAGWYNQAIAVDPLNPETVWVGGMELYRSDDGGQRFGKASWWWYYGDSPDGLHADAHVIGFHPQYDGGANRIMYVGNDGGIGRTEDARAAVEYGTAAACGPVPGGVQWSDRLSGLGTVQYYTGTTTPDGQRVLAGAQDNGTHLKRAAGGPAGQWDHVYGGDGAGVAFDPRNPAVFYVSAQNISLHRTDNDGATFVPAANGLNDQPHFIMPYLLDPANPDRLYAGARAVWRSDNRGQNWTRAGPLFGTTFGARVSALAVSHDGSRALAGNQQGIYRMENPAASSVTTPWASVSPRTGWVSSLRFQPGNRNVAYATYSTFGGDHVWKTSDGGASWSPIDGSGAGRLPDLPVHSVAIDPNNAQRLFVGTDMGVFASVDGGASWAVENTGFANVIVENLHVAPQSDPPQLFAFTYGRGAWRVPLGDLDAVPTYAIGPEVAGAFYDPAQSGQGFLIEPLVSDGVESLAVTWYTYLDGQQRWMVGVGPVTGGRARIPLSLTRGGGFPPAHVPAQLDVVSWGELQLEFTDADRATATWQSALPGFGNGSMPLSRLTRLAAPAGSANPAQAIAACHSGSWYAPSQSGHGLQVQVLDGGRSMTVVWYVYLNGEQRFLTGVGEIDGAAATVPLSITAGADFPPDFAPGDVRSEPWGTLRFTAEGADGARISWTTAYPGFNDGTLALNRLTSLEGRGCAAP
jgi:hypothetical protein